MEAVRSALSFSGLVFAIVSPGCPSTKNLQGALVLIGGDLTPRETLPEDLLRRVPGRVVAVVSTAPWVEARNDPGYESKDAAPEQDGEEYPRPPRAARARSVPAGVVPGWALQVYEGSEAPRSRKDVHRIVHLDLPFLFFPRSNGAFVALTLIAGVHLPARTSTPLRLLLRSLRNLSPAISRAGLRGISRTPRR